MTPPDELKLTRLNLAVKAAERQLEDIRRNIPRCVHVTEWQERVKVASRKVQTTKTTLDRAIAETRKAAGDTRRPEGRGKPA